MKLILRDLRLDLVTAWREAFAPEVAAGEVEVDHGGIFDLTADAVVSPANSFGFMDGGIDLAYSHHFGWHVQDRLQDHLARFFQSELLVGHATAVATDDPAIPWLICAPTMRVPMDVAHTVNAYLAFRAAVRVAAQYGFATVLSPGMATATGRMSPSQAALQMAEGYREALAPPVRFVSLGIAARRQADLLEPEAT